ncbi:peptidyl-prolyl cis-trans isomerase [Kiritimatiellaeota bacterium B1221]|nr:peptidyl-prolyl cis-trans isomerase [Kiritimatiellaeota bacterium B1221]
MRFHKLIQSRLLWLIFLGILICSFVLWGLASNTNKNPAIERLKRTVATVDGENVSFLRMDITRRMLETQAQQRIPEEMLNEMALNHLAQVAYAEKIGLGAPEDLARQQFFLGFAGEDGSINQDFVQQFRESLRGGPLTEADYIRFTQEELTLRNLARMLSSYILVPGFDVDRWSGVQTDSYTVQYAILSPEILKEEVKVSDEQLNTFFTENIDRFQLPEKRIVRFLAVDVADFTDQVSEVTNSDALDYYMERPEVYVRSVTQAATEEGGEETTIQEPIPFDEVKEEITKTLQQERARKLAEETAMSYAVYMIPRGGRSGKSLDTIAQEAGSEVQTTEAFAISEPIEALPNASAFRQAAFKLDMSDLGKRGGPVEAGDQFVVMELVEIIPPRAPAFDEVADQVKNVAQAYYTREAVIAEGEALVTRIREAVDAGASFEEELKKVELTPINPPPFDMQTGNAQRIPQALLTEITSAKTGEVVGPVDSQFGVSFIGYLAGRTPNPEAAAELAPQVRQMLSTQLHFPEVYESFRKNQIEPLIIKVDEEKPVAEEESAELESEDAA